MQTLAMHGVFLKKVGTPEDPSWVALRDIVATQLMGGTQEMRQTVATPDRAPDFVIWVEHEPDDMTSTTNILPGSVLTVHDWCDAAACMFARAAQEHAKQAGCALQTSLQALMHDTVEHLQSLGVANQDGEG